MNRGDMEEVKEKGKVCVTGGSGYLGSSVVMRLLELGYFVNTTIRSHSGMIYVHTNILFLIINFKSF